MKYALDFRAGSIKEAELLMSDSDQNDVLDFTKPQGLTLQNTLQSPGLGRMGGQSMPWNLTGGRSFPYTLLAGIT